jgi:Domain of unknown function (DUF4357)
MPRTSAATSVTILMPSGEPEGLRIVEKSNSPGKGLVFPRSIYADTRQRPELELPGVYVLWAPGESSQLPLVYVGQGDGVRARLDQHAKNKDFWTQALVFTSTDHKLNKAHASYLEARLVSLANSAKRCQLDNGNVPQLPALSEADAGYTEAFLIDMLLCMSVVGINLFEKATAESAKGREFLLKAKTKGIAASGIDSPEGFVVRAGSTAVKAEALSIHAYLTVLRHALVDKGVLIDAGDKYSLAQDYTFNSPSTAAGVLLGRTANGRIEWKDATGHSLKEIQEKEVGDG